jgi:hypothetical protein
MRKHTYRNIMSHLTKTQNIMSKTDDVFATATKLIALITVC